MPELSDEMIDLVVEEKNNSCLSDFIYGSKNVCYGGYPEDVVELINGEKFNDLSRGLKVHEAEVGRKSKVNYIGIDAQSFFTTEASISPCH